MDDRLRHWPCAGARGVIQICHGLGEHADRYARFAAAANARGYAVIAHNHPGHGKEIPQSDLGHFADRDGWDEVIEDVATVRSRCAETYPDARHILLGHSMGSYVAQCFLLRRPDATSALILSGSTWPNRTEVRIASVLARIAIFFRGPRVAGTLFDRMSFGKFNEQFRPNRTAFDWLSRDSAEVDAYVADPLCGAAATSGLWRDLFSGLLEFTKPGALATIPAALPILITGGAEDPVGGAKALPKLVDTYRNSGHDHVTLNLYEGARHEILNEINRDDVTRDILDWMDRS